MNWQNDHKLAFLLCDVFAEGNKKYLAKLEGASTSEGDVNIPVKDNSLKVLYNVGDSYTYHWK